MAVRPALTSTEISRLAGAGVVRPYLVIDDSDIVPVATARVNGDPTFPLTTLTVDGTSAGWSNVAKNMTVFIGSTSGGFDRGIYRVRTTGTGTTIELMPIGDNDSGAINLAVRTSTIINDDHVTVIDRFDPFGVFPRIDYAGIGNDATIYEDYDIAYSDFNRYPAPIVNVFIAGQPTNYATHLYDSTSVSFDISLAITLWATSSSATYAITLPSGITLNSGSLTGSSLTPTINVTAVHAATVYKIKIVVTENNGTVWTSYRKLWIKSNTYPPLDIWRIDDDGGDTSGWHMQLTLRGLTSASPAAMYHYFEMNTWKGGAVDTAAQCFTGWCVSRNEDTAGGVPTVTLELVGPTGLMDLIGAQSQIFSTSSAPTTWQELYTSLNYLDFVLWWILAQRVSGILQLFNYTSFGLDFTELQFPEWRIDAGTVLSQAQDVAQRWLGGNIGSDPGGEIMVRRRPSNVPYADRDTVIVDRAHVDETIYKSVSLGYRAPPNVRRLRGEAFYSDGTSITTVWCDAPIVPGQGRQEDKADRLIVNTADELYVDTGNEYQYRNNPYPRGQMLIQKNYAVIYPAQMSRVLLSIPAALRFDQAIWSNYVTPTSVQRTHNPDGTVDTVIAFEQETAGVPGVDVEIPVPDASTYNSRYAFVPFAPVPLWRSSNPNPAGTKNGASVLPRDGSIAFSGTANKAYYVTNLTGTPRYKDITPTLSGTYTIRAGTLQPNTLRGYLLLSDGTNSKVAYCANISAKTPSWSIGTAYAGEYTNLRTTGTAGQVFIHDLGDPGNGITAHQTGGTWDTVFNLTLGDAGFTPLPDSQVTSGDNGAGVSGGAWSFGVGWEANNIVRTGVNSIRLVNIHTLLPASGVYTQVEFSGTFTTSLGATPVEQKVGFTGMATTTERLANWTNANDGAFTFEYPAGSPGGNLSGSAPYAFTEMLCGNTNLPSIAGGTIVLTQMILRGTGTNPYTTGSTRNASVRYSSDYGATFGSALDLGLPDSIASGFDVQLDGGNSFAYNAGKVKRATAPGGAYSDYYTPGVAASCIVVPWYTYNSNTALNTANTNPDIVLGLASADGSSRTAIWIEGGATPGTIHDLTPIAGYGFDSPNSITTWKGKYIAMLAHSGSTRKLVTTIDAGTTKLDRGSSSVSTWIRVRRNASTPGQLIISGSSVQKYSSNFGAALVTKGLPTDPALLFTEFYA